MGTQHGGFEQGHFTFGLFHLCPENRTGCADLEVGCARILARLVLYDEEASGTVDHRDISRLDSIKGQAPLLENPVEHFGLKGR
jgi:hypothetical protein